ncbi:MAG: hypothetical protein CVV44_22295 [Spirochaetae bacterium HGW-Spirochaetae-1]|jgi:hypothetical protein|nr:MAG: hypothetical protein CVV44_22295 [Spirochaetae bacterium HGW-Spirochaetae-1]
MEEIGILLYGYVEEDARLIHDTLEKLLSWDIVLISASGREDSTVAQVLDGDHENCFENRGIKFLMFLGFDDDLIEKSLKGFPRKEHLARPIFCGLTENNYNWTIAFLAEHLLEEKRSWSAEDKPKEQ